MVTSDRKQPHGAARRAVTCSVAIVTFRSDISLFRRLVTGLVRELRGVLSRFGGRAEIYLISNDGDLRFADMLERALAASPCDLAGRVRFITLSEHGNIGYGAAHNLAIARTRSRYHLILNPDVEFQRGSLTSAVAYLDRDESCVLAAPHGRDAEGNYLRLAKRRPSVLTLGLRAARVPAESEQFGSVLRNYGFHDMLPSDESQEIELASGCCMLCRTEALQQVQGFDEEFFLFFEDFDLSIRLGELGSLVEVPDFRIVHHGGDASRRQPSLSLLFVRSGIRFFQKHGWRLA